MSGADRAMLYRLAMGTGFRRNELKSLTPESFDLDSDPPVVLVKAAYSKRRRDDHQPIRRDLVDTLRPWLAGKRDRTPIFAGLTKHTAAMLRRDLKAAGIDYVDSSGRFADFHALRHSYVSALAMSGAPVKVVQSLARHSTPSLTFGLYSHVGLFDLAGALEGLPNVDTPSRPEESESMAATGTDGRSRVAQGKRAADVSVRIVSEEDGLVQNEEGSNSTVLMERNLLNSGE